MLDTDDDGGSSCDDDCKVTKQKKYLTDSVSYKPDIAKEEKDFGDRNVADKMMLELEALLGKASRKGRESADAEKKKRHRSRSRSRDRKR